MPIAELVAGDIIRLNAGDLVPADARLLDVEDLQVDDSALLGESLPVEKSARDLPEGKHRVTDAPKVDSWALRFRQGLARRSTSAQANARGERDVCGGIYEKRSGSLD